MVAKLLLANQTAPRAMLRQFGLAGQQHPTVGSRSLLDPAWLQRCTMAPDLAALIGARSFSALSPQWCRSLADDQTFRYCPTCLGQGYQSVLCQMSGLQRCPIHDEPLIAHCQACGAATPPYAVTVEAFEQPMVCCECNEHFAPIWRVEPGAGFTWSAVQEEGAYARLAGWVQGVDGLQVKWPDHLNWLGDPRGGRALVQEHRRSATAAAFAHAVRAPRRLGDVAVRVLDFINPPTIAPMNPPTGQQERAVEPAQGGRLARTSIYKSIRRHVRRIARMPGELQIPRDHGELVWSSDFALLMPRNARVNPVLHGLQTWRLRFEEHLNLEAPLRSLALRPALLDWPVEWQASDTAWGHFVYECLRLDIGMARALHRAIGPLDYGRPGDRAAWLELMGLWYHRFNPAARLTPDGLTAFRRPAGSGADITHLVAAESAVCAHDT
ncbi:hypothetical protein LXT12_20585 [Pelomonas sp. P7]|uniref:TniQ protein n=1 Tax=Pelomonas caseinilytica TaxID=2906763 RepID=A0ABS8XLV7_9BURK|nr:hypothetical protein [Pelomonas sp. P7]MCE4539653.1 hypothetical protein [Pelomonas sp. P7]